MIYQKDHLQHHGSFMHPSVIPSLLSMHFILAVTKYFCTIVITVYGHLEASPCHVGCTKHGMVIGCGAAGSSQFPHQRSQLCL